MSYGLQDIVHWNIRKISKPAPAYVVAAMLLVSGALAGILSPVEAADAPPNWNAPYYQNHSLVGKIWQPREGRFVKRTLLFAELAKSRFALLGERHDNPDHHRLQALIARELAIKGQKRAIAFEMFDEGQEADIARHRATQPKDAGALGDAVGWSKTGWPEWGLYQPIAQVALDTGAPIVPASLPRATLRRIARKGTLALGSFRVGRLGLDRLPEAGIQAKIRQELVETHCGQLPDKMIDPMVKVAIAKDAVMAGALLDAAMRGNGDGAVLIAGAGHVRTDRGVPWHMRRLAPSESVRAVAFVEVDKGRNDPVRYATTFNADFLPFDFVWFTPRVDIDDPCTKFASQLKRAGQGKKPGEKPQ